MSDLALIKSGQKFDLSFDGSDLVLSDSMQGAVALSLGCFVRPEGASVAAVGAQLGGWFGDALNELKMGSELFRIFSEKSVLAAVKAAKKLAENALAWMVTDGVAKSIDVTAEQTKTGVNLEIEVVKPDGASDSFVYQVNWEASV